jgi:tripartite-type tricarboxylate transporter receptor subunit TctC
MAMPMKTILRQVIVVLATWLALISGGSSWSQPYPTKPVRLIIGGLPGTAPDVIARVIGPHVSESLGQSVIIDNRGGGAGILGAQLVAAAPADGYTVLLVGGGGLSIVPFLTKKRPYDPLEDFTPVTLVTIAPLVVACHPSLPAKSIGELIGLAKAKPKELFFASPGVGSIHHLTIELFNRAAGVTLAHVPYKGGPPAVIDAISGRVQLVITTVIPLLPHIKASRLRALAVTSTRRTSVFPEVPTVAESGVQGFESLQWFGLYAPRNTPQAARERLFGEVRKAVEIPAVASVLAQEGQEVAVNGAQALAEFHRMEIAKWQKIILHLRESGTILE